MSVGSQCKHLLQRRPGQQATGVGGQARHLLIDHTELLTGYQGESHHDVCGGELITDQKLRIWNPVFEILEAAPGPGSGILDREVSRTVSAR